RAGGGEVGPGHSVTALYVVQLQPEARGRVAETRIRWLNPTDREQRETSATIETADLGGSFTSASVRLRVDYAAAFFGEVLRQSQYGGQVRANDLAAIAESAFTDTDDAQVHELAPLIRRA